MKKRKTAPMVGRGATAPAEARRSSEFKLTAKERALLKDPEWMTEDEADLIIGMRIHAKGGYIPLEEVLARHGL
jgi:hypothetical protein